MKHTIFSIVLAGLAVLSGSRQLALAEQDSRPNFLVIVSDDQRFDTVDKIMPVTWQQIFKQGVRFPRGYVTTPQCCPSRSSIFTGMYASRHGVTGNRIPLKYSTVIEHLHAAGYYTGLIGKYLNSWKGDPRKGYDYWVSFHKGSTDYYFPKLNVNGTWGNHEGYITYLLRDHVLTFLDQAAKQSKPFVLYFAPNAPHKPAEPAKGDEDLFKDLPKFRPPNYMEADQSDKPEWLQGRKSLSKSKQQKNDDFITAQLQTQRALDRAIDAILKRLTKYGMDKNTVVIFISDNGVMWGQHGLESKDCVYEGAIRVPFAVRYPPLVETGREEQALVANIDIAPTLYDLSGVTPPNKMDGKSLVPVLKNETDSLRDGLLIEGWREKAVRSPFVAFHTGELVYVETKGDRSEFYDLQKDPYELDNRVANGKTDARVPALQARLYEILDDARPGGWARIDGP